MDRTVRVEFTVRSIIVFVLALVGLWLVFFLRDILVLFLLAFILSTALEPAVDYLQRKKVPRWTTILGIYALVIFAIFTFVRLIIPPISLQLTNLIANRQMIAEKVTSYLSHTPASVKVGVFNFANSIPSRVADFSAGSIVSNVFGVFSGILGILTVFVVSFYLLLEKGALERAVVAIWPGSTEKTLTVVKRIVQKISSWARGQLILSGSIGLLTFIGLSILKVEYAPTLALFAAFAEFVPYVGPYLSFALGVLLALTISPATALWVAILYFGIQQFEGNILVPQVMKRAVGISPVVIIFSLLAGAKLLGFIGVIIAIPVASAISVIFDYYHNKPETGGREA